MSLSFRDHTVRALGPQAAKVNSIYALGYGWEAWAQVELGLEMARALGRGRAELEFGRFRREYPTYEGQPLWRADFILEVSLAHIRHFHFGELKCQIGRERASDFARRVGQDIAKVKAAQPAAAWVGTSPRAVTGHVIAITVDPTARDQDLDARMRQLQTTYGIQWSVAAVSTDNTVKVWTWSRPIIANGRRV